MLALYDNQEYKVAKPKKEINMTEEQIIAAIKKEEALQQALFEMAKKDPMK